ncbi:MAG: hypothetical protein NPIRA06_03510 [Nitrospirales bacterium]|nr:MAG: hypothetical protein NPIRA06_03510 [Nitrospirales bacterium]
MSESNRLERGLAEASEKFNSLPPWLKTKEPIEGSTKRLDSSNTSSKGEKKGGGSHG